MKKSFVLTGLLSVLLIACMMFSACPMDSGDDDGGGGTKPEDLPDLPSGTPYAANETEAKALLGDLKPGFLAVEGQVESLIRGTPPTETENSSSVKITDNTSITGLKINYEGSETFKAVPENFMNEGYEDIAKAGDYMEGSETENYTIEFTADKSESGAVVYKGSSIGREESGSMRIVLKALSGPMSGTITVSGSQKSSIVYSLTASAGGKGGKIILEAAVEGSFDTDFNVDASWDGDMPDVPASYSGSLKVFGADDEVKYELSITNAATYQQALAYFS
jgi:hypothetical protein